MRKIIELAVTIKLLMKKSLTFLFTKITLTKLYEEMAKIRTKKIDKNAVL